MSHKLTFLGHLFDVIHLLTDPVGALSVAESHFEASRYLATTVAIHGKVID